MKVILLALFLIFSSCSFSQPTRLDSMQWANDSLDSRIHLAVQKFEEQDIDYVILRVHDSIFPISSRCRILYREDSCTHMYSLHINTVYSIDYVYVGRILQRHPDQCFDEIGKIRKDLTFDTNYFRKTAPSAFNFREHQYTLYGKIEGEYLFETFESDFVSKHHPGLLYQAVCSYMDGRCSR